MMRIPAPNFTQAPNEIFDYWLPLLKEAELKVLLVIMRKTFGWHKSRDQISLSQMQDLTGLHKQHVVKAALSLQKKGLIIKKVSGKNGIQTTIYELVVHEDSNNSYQSQFDTGTGYNLVPVGREETGYNLVPTKETIYIKNKEKEEAGASSSANAEGIVSSSEKQRRQHKIYYQNNKNELSLIKDEEILINTLKDSILKVKPDWKISNLKKWLVDAEKLLRIDKRDVEEVKKVISWIISNDFWIDKYLKNNAFEKLRENFDSHQLAMKNKKYSEKETPEYVIKQNEEVAKKIEITYAKKVPTGIITVCNNYIEFVFGQKCEQIKFNDFTFQMQIEHNLRKLGLL